VVSGSGGRDCWRLPYIFGGGGRGTTRENDCILQAYISRGMS